MSEYTKAEAQRIMCMTRTTYCTPEKCKKCGWLSKKRREWLNEPEDEEQKSK